MKILMLGWELPPHYVGGMGVVCDQLTRCLASNGAGIEFVLPFNADYSSVSHMKVTPAIMQGAEMLISSGGTYDSSRYMRENTEGTTVTHSLYDQVELFSQNVRGLTPLGDYDVIHAHDWLTFKAAIAAKDVSGLPFVAHVHATEYDRAGGNPGNPYVKDLEYRGLHAADHIFAVSQRTKNTIVSEYGINPSAVSVVHNYMDIDPNHLKEPETTFDYIQQLRGQGFQVVVNAGRMTIQKGIFHLLDTARLVIDKRPKTVFLFSGGGEQIPELIMKAAELGISRNVVFTGWVSGASKQWRDAFRVADLFVMPSVSEPLGIAPLEAISYGTPAMVTKQSGISEVIRNVLKVDYWNITEMASQICSVLDSRGLRETLLHNSQLERENMSWQPVVEKIINKYNTVTRRNALRAEMAT